MIHIEQEELEMVQTKCLCLDAPLSVVREVLNFAELKPEETLLDLGCGLGNFLFVAAEEFGAKAIGIEMLGMSVKEIKNKVHSKKMEDSIQVEQGDLFEQDVSSADIIVASLAPWIVERLQIKLDKEMKPGAKIVAVVFPFKGWKPTKKKKICMDGFDSHIFLYKREK